MERSGESLCRDQFERLYRTHVNTWRRLADWKADASTTGDDLLSESLGRVISRLDEIPELRTGYVTTTIRRVSRELSAKAQLRRIREAEAARDRELDDHGPERPDARAAVTELRATVQVAVQALPTAFRQVVQLTVFEGLSQEEVARMLGISRRTVRRRREAAFAMLKDSLRSIASP